MTGSAQRNSGNNAGVNALNNQLLQAYAQLQSSPAAAGSIRAQAAALFQQRASALASLIEQEPGEALRLAFPDDVLSELASAFPASRSQLEAHGQWEGPIEYIIEDSEDFKSHRNIRAMSVRGETLFIQFADAEPTGLKNGDVLHVGGVRAGNQVAADSGSSSIVRAANNRPTPPPPGLTCSTTGDQPSIVLMVTMPGAPLPDVNLDPQNFDERVSRLRIQDMLFNNGQDPEPPDALDSLYQSYDPNLSLTDFWQENSYGVTRTSASSQVANGPHSVNGWYTLDQVYAVDQTTAIRTAAIAAADPDITFTQYTRLFLVINGMTETVPPSTWAGMGTLGCGTLSSADGNFSASTSWMKANSFPNENNYRGAFLAIHESGHNLGLQHSNSREFGAETLGTPVAPVAPGADEEYDDSFSAMGRGLGHYAAPHKAKLGWLPGMVQTITTSLTATVAPTELGGGIRALKIRRGLDNANWLWVEYRQPNSKYDVTLSHPYRTGLGTNAIVYLDAALSGIYTGGLIHYEDVTTGTHSHLLDFTPESSAANTSPLLPDDWLDPALVGGPWLDAYSGLSITTSNPTTSTLTVSVAYTGASQCVASNPTVTLSPSNPGAKRGQSVSYTVTVKNKDSESCGNRPFDLTSTSPVWETTFSQTTLTLAPTFSASVSMTKKVPSNADYATYTVNAIATSGGISVTGLASATVKPGK